MKTYLRFAALLAAAVMLLVVGSASMVMAAAPTPANGGVLPIPTTRDRGPACPWSGDYDPLVIGYLPACFTGPVEQAAAKPAGLAQIVPNEAKEPSLFCPTGEGQNTLDLPLACLDQAMEARVKDFNGSFSGTEIDNLVMPTLLVDGKVTGEASHLGRFAYHYNAVVNMTDFTATETAQFTAANGDMIYAEGQATATVVEDPWLSTITERMTIKGGTGRFEGATGSYTIHRTANAPSDHTATQGTFEGTIVMPKGK